MPPKETNWVECADDSDLTELSSDEEEDELEPTPLPPPLPTRPPPPVASTSTAHSRAKSTRPSTQTATQKSRERRGLKTAPTSLKAHRNVNYSAASLNDWIEQGTLDLDAEYQRGIVWNDSKQMGLIDSIFHNWPIYPLLFVVTQRSDGSETRVCVDGKQRLTSIRRFILGEIAYKDPTTHQKLYYSGPRGSKRKLISSQMQSTFRNKQIACYEYDEVAPEREREIFQRVQLGVALGPADRLPAINGPVADLVRSMRRWVDSREGFDGYFDWGKARGRDFQALAQILYLMIHGTEPKKAEPTTARLETFLSQQGEDVRAWQDSAFKLMDIYCRIVQHPVLGKPLEQDLSPLEFVMSAYLMYIYRKTHTDTQLSDAIEQMRNNLKKSCSDHKFNTNNLKHVLNFIQKQVPRLKLKSGPPGERPALEGGSRRVETTTHKFKQHSETPAPAPSMASKKVVGKRKREEPEEDSDDEYVSPVKKKVAAKQKPEAQTPALEAPKRLSLASRTASTSKAKTSVKKKEPAKPAASGPVQKSSSSSSTLSGKSKSINEQVAKPSVRPSPSKRTGSVSLQGNIASGSAMPAAATTSNSNFAVGTTGTPPLSGGTAISNPASTSVPRRPLPGRAPASEASASPVIPQTLPPVVEQASSLFDPCVSVVNASTTPSAKQDRLGPLRKAKAAISSRTNGTSASVESSSTMAENAGPSRPNSSIGSTNERKKLPNNLRFGKITEDAPSPAASWAGLENIISSDAGSASRSNNQRPTGSTPMVSSQVLARPDLGVRSFSTGGSARSGALATPVNTPSPVLSPQLPPTAPRAMRPRAQAANTATRDPRLTQQISANQTLGSAGSLPPPPYSAPASIPQTSSGSAGHKRPATSSRERSDDDDDADGSISNPSSSKRNRPSAPYPACRPRPDGGFNR